jgi:hypothetical protein
VSRGFLKMKIMDKYIIKYRYALLGWVVVDVIWLLVKIIFNVTQI